MAQVPAGFVPDAPAAGPMPPGFVPDQPGAMFHSKAEVPSAGDLAAADQGPGLGGRVWSAIRHPLTSVVPSLAATAESDQPVTLGDMFRDPTEAIHRAGRIVGRDLTTPATWEGLAAMVAVPRVLSTLYDAMTPTKAAWAQQRATAQGAQRVKFLQDGISSKRTPITPEVAGRALPHLDAEHAQAPIENLETLRSTAQDRINALSDHVSQVLGAFPADTIKNDVPGVVQRALATNPQANFAGRGLDALVKLYPELADPDLPLGKADQIRQNLNAMNAAEAKRPGPDRYLLRETDPAYAAREVAVDELRDRIYGKLEDRGVAGIADLRRDIGALMQVRTAAADKIANQSRMVRTTPPGPLKRASARVIQLGLTGAGAHTLGDAGAIVGAEAGREFAEPLLRSTTSRDDLIRRTFSLAPKNAPAPALPGVPVQPPVRGLLPAASPPARPMPPSPLAPPDPSFARETPAAPMAWSMEPGETRGSWKATPTQYSSDVHATPAPQVTLNPGEEYALKWIKADMEAMPFTPRLLQPKAKGGDLEHVPGTGGAGARIYRRIVGEEGQQISGASRGDVLKEINALLAGKTKLTRLGDLILGVAREIADASEAKLKTMLETPPPEIVGAVGAGATAAAVALQQGKKKDQGPPRPADIGRALQGAQGIRADKYAEWMHSSWLGKAASFLTGGAVDPSSEQGPADLLMAAAPLGSVFKVGEAGMYSRLERAVEGLPAFAHPSKILSVAKNAASGEEIAWRGLADWLEQQGGKPIARERVLEFLKENPLTLAATSRGGGDSAGKRALEDRMDRPTKYEQYTLPGGEAYRENMLTLPDARPPKLARLGDELQELVAQPSSVTTWKGEDRKAAYDRLIEEYRAAGGLTTASTPEFKSPHFPEPNILVHSRTKERTLPNGERGLFVEEIQSDWHQQGKDTGYRPTGPGAVQLERDLTEAHKAHSLTADARSDAIGRWKGFNPTPEDDDLQRQLYDAKIKWRDLQRKSRELGAGRGPMTPPERAAHLAAAAEVDRLSDLIQAGQKTKLAAIAEADAANEAAYKKYTDLRDRLYKGTADTPFKEAWPDLALKQQLLEAAQRPDLSWIGFTSGDTQAERYDLRKVLSKIEWNPRTGVLKAYDKRTGQAVISETGVAADDLKEHIGVEAAEKLKATPLTPSEIGYGDGHVLEGDNLQVGGKGMKVFYDNLLPKRLEKILKPFGATVEQGAVPTRSLEMSMEVPGVAERVADAFFEAMQDQRVGDKVPIGRNRSLYSREQLRQGFIFGNVTPFDFPPAVQKRVQNKGWSEPAWIVKLTPEVKARLLKEGLPLLAVPAAVGAARAEKQP